MTMDVLFTNATARIIADAAYYPCALNLIRSCQHQCFSSMFIIDHALGTDYVLQIDTLLVELASAHWRGVETRLLIGGSRTNSRIRGSALLAQSRARELNINTRLASAVKDSPSHVKLLVADNWVLTGSHNWSRSMFGGQIQDSVLLQSDTLAATLRDYFEAQWEQVMSEDYDVSI
jgi:phosphatidylserine/phosphatidylglycerophosphate/cardiolipin synthase-like enzyme